ncbi:MAG: alpha/beta fold hydrolase [Elusimicrobiota bacterium]|jgi:pimeloyl-ACP methyl ester carboxylesterase
MILLWLALILALLAAVTLVLGWWGAGIILHPPKMSAMTVFPEQFGIKYEKVAFRTVDGLLLQGWFLPSPTGDDRTLLMCHGWGDNKGELLDATYFLNTAAGFNLLYFDNRSHGESEGDITTSGCLEIMDFDAAMGYLKQNHPQNLRRLGVFGLSMGAAVAAMSAHKYPEIKTLVLESPFTDFRKVISQWAWNNLHMPYFPIMIAVLWLLPLRVGRKDASAYSPLRFIAKLAPRPLLVISGSDDRLMPEADVRALYAQAQDPKELWIVPGARHAKCHETAGAAYERRVTDFFLQHLV